MPTLPIAHLPAHIPQHAAQRIPKGGSNHAHRLRTLNSMSCPFSISDQERVQRNICKTSTAHTVNKLLSWSEGTEAVGNVRTTTNGWINWLDYIKGLGSRSIDTVVNTALYSSSH